MDITIKLSLEEAKRMYSHVESVKKTTDNVLNWDKENNVLSSYQREQELQLNYLSDKVKLQISQQLGGLPN